MSEKVRVLSLALLVLWALGCEDIPRHELPELYPASGPVGVRTAFTLQRNFSSDHTFPYWDASDLYEEGYGFTFEVPIDATPYWGGFFGIGYERFPGGKVSMAGGNDIDGINLLPFYVGMTARYPFWLDEEKWEDQVAAVWLPNEPIGWAPYIRGAVGGAALLNSPDVVDSTGEKTRVFDYQIFPFFEGTAGLEYRHKNIGYWAEVGYRFYIIPSTDDAAIGDDRMARMNGLRAMVGLTWYFW